MKITEDRIKKILKTKYRLPFISANYYLNYIQKFRLKTRSFPFWIQIEPTNFCNLKCRMCIQSTDSISKKGFLSFKDFKTIVDKLPFTVGMMLQGFGEPFLNKELIKMIRYASRKGFIVETTSNGLLINEKLSKELVRSGLDIITFSLDGASKETYEYIRVGSDFDKVVNNIKRLVEIRNEVGSNLKIHINSIVMKYNFYELPNLIKLTSELNVDRLFLGFMLTHSDFPEHFNKEQKILENNPNLKKYLKKSLEEAKSKNLKVDINTHLQDLKCDFPWLKIYINYDGTVTPCCTIINKVMGNIIEDDIDKIWNNKEYIKFRYKLLSGDPPKECLGCPALLGHLKNKV